MTSQKTLVELIYDSLCDSIAVIGQDGVIQHANAGWIEFAQMNNSPCDNWRGFNYLSECKKAIKHGDAFAVEAYQGITDVISKTRDNFYMEYPCHSSFEKHWFLMRVSEIKSSHSRLFLIQHTNISERKVEEDFILDKKRAFEGELEKMRSRFSAIVEDQTELICRFSLDTTLTFVNSAYCNFFGKTKEDLLGKQFLALLPVPDQALVLARIHSLSPESPIAIYRHQVFCQNGKRCWQEWVDRAIFDNVGKILEYQSVGRDITERVAIEKELERELDLGKRLRDEIKTRNEDLENSNRELEKLNSTLALMLSYAKKTEIEIQERVVSNLRISILSLLEILKNEKLSPVAYELIETLETNAKNLTKPFANKIDSLLFRLTTRELQLANFIRQGKTNKEIMALLKLSFQTVQSHRNNLRKKLGICKKKINLRTYLSSEFQE